MTALVERHARHREPDEGLTAEQVAAYQEQIPDWELFEQGGLQRIRRDFEFKNFALALEFTNRVGSLAEDEDHHPQITLEWGRVRVEWWTHTVKGLSENDFILAAKTDALFEQGSH
jgi:4a-hydroxytetrahydrobiopterin dehydratase